MLFKATYLPQRIRRPDQIHRSLRRPSVLPNLTPAEQQSLITYLRTPAVRTSTRCLSAPGVETEIQYQPISNVSIRAGYTYLNATAVRSPCRHTRRPGYDTGLPEARHHRSPPPHRLQPRRWCGARLPSAANTSFLSATYTHADFTATFAASAYASRSDDTFLRGYDFPHPAIPCSCRIGISTTASKCNVGVTYKVSSCG